MPLSLTVNTGQAVQLGELGAVRVDDKKGQRVRLTFFTSIAPIALIPTGIIPQRFTVGVTGERRILETVPPIRAVA